MRICSLIPLRDSSSIPAKIAEGCMEEGILKDFIRDMLLEHLFLIQVFLRSEVFSTKNPCWEYIGYFFSLPKPLAISQKESIIRRTVVERLPFMRCNRFCI
jgi:hypothetical protein